MGKTSNFDEIWVNHFTEESALEFREQVTERAKLSSDPIIINIDSYGGSVYALANMLETMDSVPNKIVTHVSGKAMSCGAILYSHGDVRICGPYSTVIIHNVSYGVYGSIDEHEHEIAVTSKLNRKMLGLLAKNCSMSYKELQQAIKDTKNSRDIVMCADDSLKFGITDYIGAPMLHRQMMTEVAVSPVKTKATIEKVPGKPKRKPAKKKVTKKTKKKK